MFFAEFKKLWQSILLLVAIAFSIVFYKQSLSFIYEYLPNGFQIPHFDYAAKWQEKYGNKLTAENWLEVQQDYQDLILEVNALLAASKVAQANGVTTYAEFTTMLDKRESQGSYDNLSQADKKISDAYTEIYTSLVDDEGNNLSQKLSSFEYIKEGYELYAQQTHVFQYQQLRPAEKEQLTKQLFDAQENWRKLLPSDLRGATVSHYYDIFFLLMILLSLLIPSVFVRDRLLGLRKSQWSSRKGRKLVATQWRVSFVASLLIITGTVAMFIYKYYQTDFTRYFSSGLTSFLAEGYPGDFSLLDINFGQWFYLLVLVTVLLSMAFAGIVFFYSQTSKNYLSLILKLIPTIVVFKVVSEKIMKRAFLVDNPIYQVTRVLFSELYLSGGILVVCFLISLFPLIRSRKQDVLS